MRFAPKTEDEIASAGLLPAGDYDFEVVDALEKQSKSGNDMIEMRVRLYDQDGGSSVIFDYLVDTDRAAYKIRHFAEAIGLLREYEKGELCAPDLQGRAGRCKVAIQKDATGQYPDKNTIRDYLKAGTKAPSTAAPRPAAKKPAMAGDIDDEIPF